jgi:hypothetical protein
MAMYEQFNEYGRVGRRGGYCVAVIATVANNGVLHGDAKDWPSQVPGRHRAILRGTQTDMRDGDALKQ